MSLWFICAVCIESSLPPIAEKYAIVQMDQFAYPITCWRTRARSHLGQLWLQLLWVFLYRFFWVSFSIIFRHKSHTEFAQHHHGPMMLQVQVKGSSGCSTSGNTRCALVPTLSLPTLVCTVLPPWWLERRARQGGNSTPLGPGHPHCHLLPLGVTLIPPLIPVSLGQCFHGRIQQILSS